MEKDCYEVLGVPRDANPDEIKAAYRSLALQRHPDMNAGDPSAGESFMRIQAAYEVLGNPYRRARYDMARSWRGREAGAPRRTIPERGRAATFFMIVGALVALRGFAGIVLDPQEGLIPQWLFSESGRDGSFRLYIVGTAMMFCAAGFRRPRRD